MFLPISFLLVAIITPDLNIHLHLHSNRSRISVRSVGSQFVCRSISAGSLGSCPRLFRSRSSPDSKWSRAFAFRRWTNMSIHGDITAAHSKRGFLNVPDGGNLLACPTCLNIHVNGIFVSGGSHEIHLNCSLHHKSSPTKSSISIIPALPPASRHFVYIALRTTANGCEKTLKVKVRQ